MHVLDISIHLLPHIVSLDPPLLPLLRDDGRRRLAEAEGREKNLAEKGQELEQRNTQLDISLEQYKVLKAGRDIFDDIQCS